MYVEDRLPSALRREVGGSCTMVIVRAMLKTALHQVEKEESALHAGRDVLARPEHLEIEAAEATLLACVVPPT